MVAGATLALCAGCPRYHDADVPNDILKRSDPETGNKYFLYVPSSYDPNAKWPLVVLCHGTRPWDSARRQMLDWVQLAEEKGFLVAAPELAGTSSAPKRRPAKQVAMQREDERRILGMVRHVRAGYEISEDRIFLTGWSAGGFAVLYTGLKHPQVFRALALQQGNFNAAYLSELADGIDPYQPVCVISGALDMLTGKDAKRCVKWLEAHHVNLQKLEVNGGHRGHPEQAQSFFEKVLRREPWLFIRTFGVEGADPLTVRFKTKSSFRPEAYGWSFGDGGESPVAEPVHRFAAAGTYRVRLTVRSAEGKRVERAVELTVPQIQAFESRRTRWDEPEP